MALTYPCPHCGQPIVVKFTKVGEEAQCKNCWKRSRVPATAAEASAAYDVTALCNAVALSRLRALGSEDPQCLRIFRGVQRVAGQDTMRSMGNLCVTRGGFVYLPVGSINPRFDGHGAVGGLAGSLLAFAQWDEVCTKAWQALNGESVRDHLLKQGSNPDVLVVPAAGINALELDGATKYVEITCTPHECSPEPAREIRVTFATPEPEEMLGYLKRIFKETASGVAGP